MIRKRKEEKLNPVVAEIKVHSPKFGDLLGKRDPIEILKTYESCRVAGISYITERKHFKGDFELFKRICKLSHLPVLRKDFVTSKVEIERTAEAEADAVLLIARILKDKTAEFVDFALEHGLESVVEVHSEKEVEFAVETNTPIIGINNRDISKLEKDGGSVEVTKKLAKLIPRRFVRISESGIANLNDLKIALSYADAALVGTAFMKADRVEDVVRSFVEAKLC
ncbi:Indole-3-glycerol-phosphate synthase [Ferroglobus placidus DSM 10642]|uniref:Indole-3-glycerol phosphate synthase n=2 Tax=Ferroglobus placidus TaxID=54261 RepID=D3S068_FERPA|nr:Indole-3-glycerol-phosphate synthase [Ferroglobus placidus DSM 10642]